MNGNQAPHPAEQKGECLSHFIPQIRHLCGRPIRVLIGAFAWEKEYFVHEALICEYSTVFKERVAEAQPSKQMFTIRIHRGNPEMFAFYLHLLYVSNTCSPHSNFSLAKEIHEYGKDRQLPIDVKGLPPDPYLIACELYLVCIDLDDQKTKSKIEEAVRNEVERHSLYDSSLFPNCPPVYCITLIHDNTLARPIDEMLILLATKFAKDRRGDVPLADAGEEVPADFWELFMKVLKYQADLDRSVWLQLDPKLERRLMVECCKKLVPPSCIPRKRAFPG